MLDLQAEQHDRGQPYGDLYEAVAQWKRRYDLHPCAVQPRDGLALRRDGERELIGDLVKRFRDLPTEQQRRRPALLNSLAQLEVVIGDPEWSQRDFQEVARLVADPIAQAVAHHNVYRVAVERRDWEEALAALRRAVALDAEQFEPFSFARYRPQRILGGGGFGVSFLCRQREGGQPVVVKSLRMDNLDRDAVVLFREINTLQDLDNPYLVRVLECGGADARPYVVLEYVESQTLGEHVVQHGPLTPEEWLQIAWPLARTLQTLHLHGILHRSLRPSALLLRQVSLEQESPLWHIKLLDSGLSLKRVLIHACSGHPAARTRTALGRSVARAIAFTPMEVIGRPKGQVWIGPHSDIYSFGKLCAFALTGQPDADASDLAPLSEAWRQLLADCTAWTIADRPPHFGMVLDRLAQLPEAGELVDRLEREGHEITIAKYSAALKADAEDTAALVRRGKAYLRQGEMDNALADFTRALQLRPDDADLHHRRAWAYAANDNLDAALADYSEALRLNPRRVETLVGRATIYFRKDDFDAALADYTEALRLNPRDAAVRFHRGNAYAAKSDYAAAIADFSEAIRLDPRPVWAYANRGKTYLRMGNAARAVADFTRVLQVDPQDVFILRQRAAARTFLRQYEDAVADYTAALAVEASPALYHERGLIYLAQHDFAAAVRDFTEAVVLAPEDAVSYVLRGEAYAFRSDFEAALSDLSEAIRLDPHLADAYFHRGNLHAQRGAPEEALADYQRTLELQTDHAAAYFQRGNLHAANGVWEPAIADYSAALQAEPDNAAALVNRGNAYRSLGDYRNALADYDQALQLDANDAAIWCNRANVHVRLGDNDRALADYSESLRLNPALAGALAGRGNVHADKGDLTAALTDYSAALRCQPDDVALYHNRGRIHARMGQYEQAIADNLEALRLAPEDAGTRNNLAWLWSSSPHAEHRHPNRAIEYARQACEQTQWRIAAFIDTLAAAHAAAGQFTEAIAFQKQALELATEEEKAEYRARLELYETGFC